MQLSKLASKGRYVSSLDERNTQLLTELNRSMSRYYLTRRYHDEWVKGFNSDWHDVAHAAQIEMSKRIPQGATVLEFGCGDGSASRDLCSRVKDIKYYGIDLNSELWKKQRNFIAGSAQELPITDRSVDVVISMFVLEHLVFPARALNEAWRVLRPSGSLIIIAPDFVNNAMASERIGFSYGSGREKLARGEWLDAMVTFYDSRVRLALLRKRWRRLLDRGETSFLVQTEPRCLHIPGFINDCDAVYPVSPEEIVNHIKQTSDYSRSEIFYRDRSTFGLQVFKKAE